MPEQEAEIRADSLVEDAERRQVTGEGFVEVHYLGNSLQADRVEINTETGDGVATGDVVFEDRQNRLVCDRLEFNLRSQQALLYGVRGRLGGLYYVSAPRMERLDAQRYRIYQGGFTTCSGPVPVWSFGSQSTFAQLGGHAFINQPTFWVRGLPAGYAPYLIVPIQTERATGFLVPVVGYSSRDGFRYDQDFFWAFSENADATFGVDYRGQRGFGPKAELRYRLGAKTEGSLDAKYLHDDLTHTDFYRIRGNHDQEFGERFRGFYRAERVNRRNFDQELEKDLGLRTRDNVESVVNLERSWDIVSARFTGLFQDSTEVARDDFFRRFPDLGFSVSPFSTNLGPLGIGTSLSASAIQFYRRERRVEDRVWRLDLRPRVTFPFTGLGWFTFSPFAEARETFYSRGRGPGREEVSSFSRELWEVGVSSEGPRLFRTFETGLKEVPSIRHLAATRFTYTFRPDIDREDRRRIVQFDDVDTLSRTSLLEYAWEHRFLAKVQKEGGIFETRDVMDLTLSQSLDLNKLTESTGGPPRRPLSNLNLSAQVRPFPLWRLGLNSSYNVHRGTMETFRISLDLHEGREWYLRFEESFNKRNDEHFFSAGGGIRFLDVWHLEGNYIWDGDRGRLLEQDYRIRYQPACWGIDFGLQDRPNETVFFLTFNLVGIFGAEEAPFFKFGGPEFFPELVRGRPQILRR